MMTSACIFGSTARKRVDVFSDRDMLVIAPSEQELPVAARDWSLTGWNVSTFTHQQILGMADRGSLFLQHVKQEGILVRDDDDFLASVIHRYRPRHEYETDAQDSIALLNGLPRFHLPYWPTLCAADIAYGAIRNIAILRLATRGGHTFLITRT